MNRPRMQSTKTPLAYYLSQVSSLGKMLCDFLAKKGKGHMTFSFDARRYLSFLLMSRPDKTTALPPSFGLSLYLIPTACEHRQQAQAGPSIEEPASRLEHDFNFQIVVFEVWFLTSNLQMKQRSQHLSKRSRIGSFRFLGMASMFREPLSRQCLHYRRHKRIVLKAAVLKILSICRESRWTTFVPSCVSCIRCTF